MEIKAWCNFPILWVCFKNKIARLIELWPLNIFIKNVKILFDHLLKTKMSYTFSHFCSCHIYVFIFYYAPWLLWFRYTKFCPLETNWCFSMTFPKRQVAGFFFSFWHTLCCILNFFLILWKCFSTFFLHKNALQVSQNLSCYTTLHTKLYIIIVNAFTND